MKLILMFAMLFSSLASFAAVTEGVNLTIGKYVPLYDCSIYVDANVQEICTKLGKKKDVEWYERGYAVDCQDLKKKNRKSCIELADRLAADNNLIECSRLSGRSQDECQTTKNAYSVGRFEATQINACSSEAYERSYYIWKREYDRRKKNGKKVAAIGIGATILGTGLRVFSDNDAVEAIGAGLQVGGLVLAQLGLVEMEDAYFYAPHTLPYCGGYYIPEVRRVVVDRQHCHATRYYHRDYYSTRYYYRVRCHNRSYVTYQYFSPWENGY